MHVALDLANPNGVFTNLDTVSGRVLLVMSSTSPITNITVKLEGETQSQIVPPHNRTDDRRPRPVHEYHKILYDTQIVFPINELASSTHYTLAAGTYEYPFSFKIPFNTTCHSSTPPALPSFPQYIKGSPVTVTSHIKAPLPPTLGGFPGLAAIRYYVKVTVNRKEFYKENPRVLQHINFAPIEPPRPSPSAAENYGRRQYQFPSANASKGKPPKLGKMLSNLKLNKTASIPSPPSPSPDQAPKVEVDARLPDPAILTVGQPLPLRILVKRLDAGAAPLYLQTLQIELVGHTRVRAGQYQRTEASSWVVTSHANMDHALAFAAAAEDDAAPPEKGAARPRMLVLDNPRWAVPLPANIAPSFATCNIARWYELDVRVGLGHGAADAARRNQIVLPLRLRCAVYSGIAPPERLLSKTRAAVAKKPLSPAALHNAARAQADSKQQLQQQEENGESSSSSGGVPQAQAQADADAEEPPPPSYEDAMAQEDLGPVSGPRVYEPGPAPAGDDGFPRDQKRRGS